MRIWIWRGVVKQSLFQSRYLSKSREKRILNGGWDPFEKIRVKVREPVPVIGELKSQRKKELGGVGVSKTGCSFDLTPTKIIRTRRRRPYFRDGILTSRSTFFPRLKNRCEWSLNLRNWVSTFSILYDYRTSTTTKKKKGIEYVKITIRKVPPH